ncbi:MAG: nucleotidyltransferase family protein [Hylemonella sp.]|uniref:nucleotidyltransferase family protein n=1 Tax=Hylemonella sp. TaxID=2066020 RepID=UPI0022C7886F|nr:nucleotidyltransferase family protein [Hylemonella sp.]MCZ8253137.1 nucleotidyltransferase family protein [Hylemonella sp.]
MNPTVLVLASGRGERFLAAGGGTHKLQALLDGKTVLQHTLDAVRASGLPWHLEEAPHPGMGDSIAAAVRATPHAEGWLILPADLPLVLPETLRRIAAAPDEQTVVRPIYQGRQGHPVRFARTCAEALMALGGKSGAAAVVRRHRLWTLAVDDPGCVTDIDTPEDLVRARQILQARS